MANFDLANLALKATCPGNEIILDDKGLPSVMVKIPKFNISDVITGASSTVHPAFKVNGNEVPYIYISKFQNVIHSGNGRAYSLPGEDPKASLNFDAARVACELKGPGWHLMTNAEWAAIALWCRKNSLMPKGNNNYGKDTSESTYVAIPTTFNGSQTNRVATGTGPVTWSHNGEVTGIWDLNGNVYEWQGGYRTKAGEIQILENNNAADSDNSQAVDSTAWKAILPDGSLVAPGTAGTLKWDFTTTPAAGAAFRLNTTLEYQQTDETPYGTQTFESLTAKAGVTVPEILKALALFPADAGDHGGDYFYMRNLAGDERLAYRGGYCYNGANAGVFSAYGYNPRSIVHTYIGFRSAYIPGI
jgi:hypothetical protein